MASSWNNSPQDLFIGSLQLLLCVSAASALTLKRSCLYGAGYQDNRVLHGLWRTCYVIAQEKT